MIGKHWLCISCQSTTNPTLYNIYALLYIYILLILIIIGYILNFNKIECNDIFHVYRRINCQLYLMLKVFFSCESSMGKDATLNWNEKPRYSICVMIIYKRSEMVWSDRIGLIADTAFMHCLVNETISLPSNILLYMY